MNMAKENVGCNEPNLKLMDRAEGIGKMLAAALMVTVTIKAALFGTDIPECKRPECVCVEDSLIITENGMQSLLQELTEIRERL